MTKERLTEAELLALPLTVGLVKAASAWGIGRTKAYELARAGEFPCEVLPLGRRFVVTKATLLAALGVKWDPAADRQPDTEPSATEQPAA